MNSFEQIIETLAYRQPEKIPVLPVLLLHGAKMLNMPLPAYLQDSNAIIRGQSALLERYGHDGIFGVPCFIADIEAFGGKLAYSECGSPSVGKMAWRTWADMEAARPVLPKQHPVLSRILQTTENIASIYKGKKLIIGGCIGPFSLPSILIGTEKWMELLWEDELLRGPIMRQCLEICKDFCITWANAQLQAGADIVVIADGMASATCIMREQFEQFALPYIKKTISAIQGPVGYEPLGRIEPFIDLLPDIGAKLLLLECEDNLANCKKALNGKMAIMGNINNIQMTHWTKQEAIQASQQALQQGAPGGGFILSNQGPEVPWDTPEEVIEAIVQSARNWQV